MANTYSAGIATAYGAAVRGGYTGTYDEWCALMADYATVGESAEQAAQNAAASASAAATSESNAATSEQNAAASESAASAAATDATEARADAQTAAGAASDSADNAASSALAASQSESAASTSASAAAGDATAAAGSASAAAQTLTDVNAAGAAQITAIDAEGQRVLASIPADYTDLSGEVSDLKSQFNLCLQISPEWQEQDFTISTDSLRDNTTFVESTSSSFNNTYIAVSEGERYKISGWSNASEYAPAYWSDNALVAVISAPRGAFTDFVTTVPAGATRMMVNGRSTIPIAIAKDLQTEESVNFINNITKKHLGVQRTAADQINVFMSDYDTDTDLECRFIRKSGNSLPDIQGWYRCANAADEVLTESDGNETSILKSSSDFLGPSVIYAVNNMDGDFPSLTERKLTGGWHMYDSQTSGNYTPTARNLSLDVECDGKIIAQGETAKGNEVVITIVNRLQASNTEKADGTGREVAELMYRITFREGFKADIYGSIKALEEIHYAEFIGISAYLMTGQPFRWVGSRVNRQAITPSSTAQRCGDKYCTSILQTGEHDVFEIAIDPTYDLGTMYANLWTNSFTSSSNKGYANYINQDAQRTDASRLALNADDVVHWHGFYNFYSK